MGLQCSCIACGGKWHSSPPCDRLAFHGPSTGTEFLSNDIKTRPQQFLHRANFIPLKAKLLSKDHIETEHGLRDYASTHPTTDEFGNLFTGDLRIDLCDEITFINALLSMDTIISCKGCVVGLTKKSGRLLNLSNWEWKQNKIEQLHLLWLNKKTNKQKQPTVKGIKWYFFFKRQYKIRFLAVEPAKVERDRQERQIWFNVWPAVGMLKASPACSNLARATDPHRPCTTI